MSIFELLRGVEKGSVQSDQPNQSEVPESPFVKRAKTGALPVRVTGGTVIEQQEQKVPPASPESTTQKSEPGAFVTSETLRQAKQFTALREEQLLAFKKTQDQNPSDLKQK